MTKLQITITKDECAEILVGLLLVLEQYGKWYEETGDPRNLERLKEANTIYIKILSTKLNSKPDARSPLDARVESLGHPRSAS